MMMISTMTLFVHLCIHLFICSFIYSFVPSFICSFIHSFINIHSFLHSFIPSGFGGKYQEPGSRLRVRGEMQRSLGLVAAGEGAAFQRHGQGSHRLLCQGCPIVFLPSSAPSFLRSFLPPFLPVSAPSVLRSFLPSVIISLIHALTHQLFIYGQADDPSTYMEVVDVAAKNDNWEELVKYLQVDIAHLYFSY